MKKITFLAAVFTLIISIQSVAQQPAPVERDFDRFEHRDEARTMQRHKMARKNRAFKRAKMRKRADRRQMRAMRKVARADGLMSPRERAVIKRERRKMSRNNKRALKRRAVRRNQRLRHAPGLHH